VDTRQQQQTENTSVDCSDTELHRAGSLSVYIGSAHTQVH